jgi:uncharacterized membrane protein YuzA (DUF378 family)
MTEQRFQSMKGVDIVSASILALGGLNWGLIGFFDFNLVEAIFGATSALSRIIYCLVGMSAFYEIAMFRTIQRRWECAGWLKSARQVSA